MTSSTWTRSTFCDAGYCVEVRAVGNDIHVRDSRWAKTRDTVLVFTPEQWLNVLAAVRADEIPAPYAWANDDVVVFSHQARRVKTGVTGALPFTHAEWRAFAAGVKAGQFDLDVLTGAPTVAAQDSETGEPAGPLLPDAEPAEGADETVEADAA